MTPDRYKAVRLIIALFRAIIPEAVGSEHRPQAAASNQFVHVFQASTADATGTASDRDGLIFQFYVVYSNGRGS